MEEQSQVMFRVTFDERTKQVLCAVLDNAISMTSQQITAGDYSDELLQQHEELVQVKRGILYSRPEEVPIKPKEETPEEMYKSQDRPQ